MLDELSSCSCSEEIFSRNSSGHTLVDPSLPAAVRMSFVCGVGLAAAGGQAHSTQG